MLDHSSRDLSQAILQTVAYSDLFDYPLSAREIHRYLTGVKATLEEVVRALREDGIVGQTDGYFTLQGREEIVGIRMRRVFHSSQLLPSAIAYGRMLGNLPYIRMVSLTGSLAVMNVSGNPDFDYMLVTAPGRLWIARAFALALNRLTRLQGYTLCPNLIVSELALEWSEKDLYSARELCQMIPITGFETYRRLLHANDWVERFLPNAYTELEKTLPAADKQSGAFQALLEFILRGNFGDRLEQWEMNRKIARFSKQAGFGEETVFNANVCQGNFQHHRTRTRELFENKLSALKKEKDVTVTLNVSVT